MARPLHFHKPTCTELRQLLHGLETITDPVIRQRIEVIVTLCYTPIASEVAQLFNLHLNTILGYVRRFNRYRLGWITAPRKCGRSASMPRRVQQQIVAIAQRTPSEWGLPDGTWSLSRLQWFVTQKRKLLRYISREHVRRIKRKLQNPDPRRRAILARIAWAIRHLPPNAVVLFMDEKGPITVKRYGGSVWTTAAQVVLPKYQKTRGKFYLYSVYELFTGRVRWRYYDHKRAEYFTAFLREIRRWYPGHYILVILDQDTTHPQKCLASRQEMRRLKIHWLSLPKKSPDDNPIETLFSLLQRAILAGSDARDVPELKRRISRFLWRHNRCTDPRVHLSYLDDFYNQ